MKALLVIVALLLLACPLAAAAQAGAPQSAPASTHTPTQTPPAPTPTSALTPTPTPAASAPVDEKQNPTTASGQPAAAVTPADNVGTQPLSTVGTSAGAVTPERGTTPVSTTPVSEASVPLLAPAAKGSVALPPEKAAPVRIPRVERAPVIDGKLDEDIWRQAAVLKDFYQISPGDNIAPSLATEVYLAYDARTLYIAFRAHDDPSKVRATVAKRDDVLSNEDSVRVLLDTFNDRRKAYVLVFNPLGIQQDGIRTEGQGVDFSFDLVMESKGALNGEGYVVEAAIPFKSLKYESGRDKLWGLQVFRQIQRFNNETDSWMPISRDINGLLNQAGHITGIENISTERTIDFIPSLTVSEEGRRVRTLAPRDAPFGFVEPGRFVNQSVKLDPGFTGKFAISPTMTLDLALNPDFAQVEADQLVVTTNQRFPIFFPERRPFFLEGIEIFQTPLGVVNTRTIVDPDIALKLTGRRGANTYGLLVASDNGPGNFSADDRTRAIQEEERRLPTEPRGSIRFLDKNAFIGVFRLNRNVGQENTIGAVATTSQFKERHNQTGGIDGRFKLAPQTTAAFSLLGTVSHRTFFNPDLGVNELRNGRGAGYTASYAHFGRNFGYEYSSEGRTRDYRADVGFTSRTNTNFHGLFASYNTTPKPKATLINWRVHNFSFISHDFQGRSQAWESETNFQLFFQRQFNIGAAYEYGYERLIEEEFGARRLPAQNGRSAQRGAFAGEDSERSTRKHHYFFFGGYRPSKKYSFNWRAVYRDGHFDFDFGANRHFPRVSPVYLDYLASPAYLEYLRRLANPDPSRPARQPAPPPLDPGRGGLLEFRGSFAYQPTNALRSTLDYTKSRLRRYDTNLVAFDVNLVSWRTTYQFTRFLFARARIDYESLPRRARGQFLLGYTPNPGTAFYAGYNDDVNVNTFSPFGNQLEPGFRRNGRTFFVKMSYLFRRSFGG
ncbi:MAG TPA: DUF5916 domain-containing protein [Pyrinomonadaceae bacterium]|nr:DUF5916 domain-containing protein [Pyrinomonadaceae bacterium]